MAYDKLPLLGITSSEVKNIKNLYLNKKVPSFDNCFVCEGLWAAEKLVAHRLKIRMFLFCPDYIKTSVERARVDLLISNADSSFLISGKTCAKISDRDGADGFFIVAEAKNHYLDDIELHENMVIAILDGLEQPGNIGSIIRSADCAGSSAVISINKKCKLTHSRLVRSSLGASFTMPVIDADFNELINWLEINSFTVYLTDLSAAVNYYEPDYSGRIAIVAGNEFNGISNRWKKHNFCRPIIIPMFGE
ncbi:MAG: hypothetical protein LBI03_04735, partial [Clostridiales bacterium]|nr:hypothetical protein [Clostridiales bacterium]